jgi:hypothetical protein
VKGSYAAVLLAFGFGTEKSTIEASPFVGHRFWDTDHLEDPTYDGRIPPGDDQVLISGTGDGGLQDFLRVMTRKSSARMILSDLGLANRGLRLDVLHSLENRMERAAAWANARGSLYPFTNRPYLKERHEATLKEVDRLLVDPRLRADVIACMARRPKTTYLISQDRYFASLYGLNLFLVLLLVRALKGSANSGHRCSVRVLAGRRIMGIQPADGRALPESLSARDCVGPEWHVWLERIPRPILANVIVIRHGLSEVAHGAPPADASHVRPRPMPPTHLHQPDGPG